MTQKKTIFALCLTLVAALFAACSGGGGGSATNPSPPVSSQQVVRLALPTTAIGVENDPTYGLVAGYTQSSYSQVLAFAPGQQIMIENDQSGGTPHTLGDTGGTNSFPENANLSMTARGGNSLSHGFQTGTLTFGKPVGPITLQSGTYFIGCAYHYASNGMRDVLIVNSGAAPGPQATGAPGGATAPPSGGTGY